MILCMLGFHRWGVWNELPNYRLRRECWRCHLVRYKGIKLP